MIIFTFIVAFAAIVLAFMCIGVMSADISDLQKKSAGIEIKIAALRQELDEREVSLSRLLAESQDLKLKQIDLQNKYTATKRLNEELAHRLMRGDSDAD